MGAADDGQVSETQDLSDGPVPIADDQAVAGYPDSESGSPDEGPAGPNANTNAGDGTGEPSGGDRPHDDQSTGDRN
jgi:hypothetical protein